jgi:hypothetical protein
MGVFRADLILDAGFGAENLVSTLVPNCRLVISCDYHVPGMSCGAHVSKYHWDLLETSLTAASFIISRGTLNHRSPFVAPFSSQCAGRLFRWDLKEGR